MYLKLVLILALSSLMAGCENLGQIALEKASDSRIRYDSQCESLRIQCRAENYSEWETSEGRAGCSCAGDRNQSRSPADFPDAI